MNADAHETHQPWQHGAFGISFISLLLCVGCCGMHKILFSQQPEVVEELVWDGVGEEARRMLYSIWTADSCVRLCGSLG